MVSDSSYLLLRSIYSLEAIFLYYDTQEKFGLNLHRKGKKYSFKSGHQIQYLNVRISLIDLNPFISGSFDWSDSKHRIHHELMLKSIGICSDHSSLQRYCCKLYS